MNINEVCNEIVSSCEDAINYIQVNTDAVFFMILATIALVAALHVVRSDEVMHSAFYLALVFVCVGIVYFFLEAEFVGVIQVIVYVGAITMLYAFSIMLTRRTIMKKEE
ncbi:MAG: NADH-quinone oxidoreductase subunit J [archaeon]|nr:NADH-quinone oxidoreductase subunit J [archaeon]